MERKFKHKLTNKILVIGGKTGESMLKYISSKNDGITLSEIITNSNDWEEIVEKEYEILTLLGSDDKIIPYLTKTECIDFLAKCGFKIYSVKRLSDGEVFTIGDKVDSTISDLGRFTDLTGFKLYNNKMLFGLRDLGYYPLSTIIKYKKPLFTTEDNVDIFEGDKYFQLAVSFSPNFREAIYEEIARPNIKYSYNCKEGREQLNKNGRYYFSTKEAAEEYALTVKPCLSVKDILKRFNSRWSEVTETTLKELVKSKI